MNRQKLIKALQQKKQRDNKGLFVLEGDRIISDLIQSGELNEGNVEYICGTKNWIDRMSAFGFPTLSRMVVAPEDELKKLSAFQTPPEVLAIVKTAIASFNIEMIKENYTLVFDKIRDPGNLGTIIRTADWFGIRNIICSIDSVDHYNNKVVQASMGSIMRMNVHYMELHELFSHANRLKVPVYGTAMDGVDLFDTPVKKQGIIVFGNESAGIDPRYGSFFKTKLRIPNYPGSNHTVESLNIASSVAVTCSELRRRER
ncbi:MAG: RNA methyltransferase [Bacteroidales bacterium]